MATLTANINSAVGEFDVSGDVSAAVPGTEYRIDDEVITLRSFKREPLPWSPRNRGKWIVSRGMSGTTPATHLAAAEIVAVEEAVTTSETLAPPEPFAGEGGGSIAATDKQIVFMDGSTASGSADLTLDAAGGNATLGLASAANGAASITAIGVGAQMTLTGHDGDASHVGGELILESGSSGGQNGGQITIQAGSDGAGGDGGAVNITSGGAAAGTSGDIDIRGGNGAEAGTILIKGGTASDGDGGGITIEAGSAVGGNDGWVAMQSAGVEHSVYLDSDGIILSGKTGFFGHAAVVRPTGVAVDAAAIHAALVNLGLITA
jgi:hypothetical protein